MTVSPVRYELSTGRGGTITKPITIYNRSKFPVFLTLTAENFLSKGTDGQPTLLPQSETQDPQTHLASWTSTDINSINLAA